MLCTSLVNKVRFEKLETDYKMVANADSIWKVTVRDIYNEDCVWRKCEKCTPKSIEKLFPFKDTDDIIEYFQWETVMVERNEKENYRTTKKLMKTGTVADVIIHLEELLADFSIHNHTNINQLHNFKQAKKNLKEKELIISEDFSENYSLKQQNEIMSAHWSQEELSLFCATAHYLQEGKPTFNHYVLCSDDLTHDKNTIFFYNSNIINDLKSKGLIFDMVRYWSDGPSSQFKNQYNFTNLLLHQKDHSMPADWNFFATSHGKGENDGAGGDVKNAVWRKVLQNKAVVADLESFVSLAKAKFPSFTIEGFTSTETCNATRHLPEQYEKHSKSLPSTQKFHHVTTEEKKSCWLFPKKNMPMSPPGQPKSEERKESYFPNARS